MENVSLSQDARSKSGLIRSIEIKLGLFGKSAKRRFLLFLLLIAPAFILRIVTAAYPILQTVRLSFTNLDLIKNTNAFVGMKNYRTMLVDPGVKGALSFTILMVVASTVLELAIGMLIALMLNANFRGRGFARTINLIPWAVPTIVAGYVFRWIMDDQFGLVTTWIYQLSGAHVAAFIHVFSARLIVILAYVWKDAPFIAVIFLAGLQGVGEDLYEAAKVDGANAWNRFWHITIPLTLPLTVTMGMFRLLWSLGNFDLVYGLTQGGPGVATSVLALQVFRNGILFFKFGMASAISIVLLILVAIIGVVGLWLFRKTEVSL
jgi:multiple sugar transport system permease protein